MLLAAFGGGGYNDHDGSIFREIYFLRIMALASASW
ncbi:unnamed protein product [Musa acuminata subsp. burmannicoides]|uniref:(wild Malaysian banana) hypothetical protein n=1 Tax=Musa acuminata subsp. malaccensis TaxID=214687 RepID=A0A804L7B8_MUSAM|nr:unnamed protein product [Musa acuminata subsp. malaccensis]